MTQLLDVPVRREARQTDVCHIAKFDDDPTVTMCGTHVQEGWCCDHGKLSCGRPPCPLCHLADEQDDNTQSKGPEWLA